MTLNCHYSHVKNFSNTNTNTIPSSDNGIVSPDHFTKKSRKILAGSQRVTELHIIPWLINIRLIYVTKYMS
jgi:hypothetical protein